MNKQQIIDEVLEEVRKRLEDEFTESELTRTEFKCIDTKGEVIIVNSKEVPAGTVIGNGTDWEAFRILSFSGESPWVTYTGTKHTHETFAHMVRCRGRLPKIIHWGL